MISAREVGRGDRYDVLTVLRSAFEKDTEARLVEALWTAQAVAVERLIEADGRVVAYAAVTPVRLEQGRDLGLALGLAPVAVAPEKQKIGIGAQLVEATINATFQRYPTRLLFVLGDPRYYRRFGFFPAASYGYRWEGGDVGEAFQVMAHEGSPRISGSTVEGVLALGPVTVRYHDAFSVFGEAAE